MRIAALMLVIALSFVCNQSWAASTEFTYQGQLRADALPANGMYDLKFALFDAVTAGNQINGTISTNAVTVTNGLFTVPLDFGTKSFSGQDRWLEISVQATGGGSFTTLTPRQKLTASPYALALPNLRTEASMNGPNFLSANVIGGSSINSVAAGVTGVVIAGGGATNGFPQQINANYSCIGGGYSNTIGANGGQGTIAGGVANSVGASGGTIGGGQSNSVSGLGSFGTVAGGQNNMVSGANAMVAGGISNTAAGTSSFAAGNRAKANNAGSFVWGDSTAADVTSTANDQFTIRANGGVVVNTAADVALNATNGVTLSVSNNNASPVPVGTLYKDNTVVAWGRILGNSLDSAFNVKTFVRNSAGNYTITLNTTFSTPDTLVPTVTAAYNAAPTAATIRFAGAGPLLSSTGFNVYTTNAAGTAADSDFTFIVTGR